MAPTEEKIRVLKNAEERLRSLADMVFDMDEKAAVKFEQEADIIREIIHEYVAAMGLH